MLFTPTFKLVEGLLRAKQEHDLERELKRLDRFQVVVLDDFGYVQQSRQEMEVLFTFLAERYERRSVVITSNLVFSQWDQIFKDPLTTAAAIDRVVHHSRILEFGPEMTSVRAEQAAPASPDPGRNDAGEDGAVRPPLAWGLVENSPLRSEFPTGSTGPTGGGGGSLFLLKGGDVFAVTTSVFPDDFSSFPSIYHGHF